jgi:hypothetical protein
MVNLRNDQFLIGGIDIISDVFNEVRVTKENKKYTADTNGMGISIMSVNLKHRMGSLKFSIYAGGEADRILSRHFEEATPNLTVQYTKIVNGKQEVTTYNSCAVQEPRQEYLLGSVEGSSEAQLLNVEIIFANSEPVIV